MFWSAASGGVRAEGATVAAALLLAVALAAGVAALVIAGPARAASFTVTTADDSGSGSLRQAIADANASAGEDTIGFAPSLSGQTIALASQLPAVTDSEGLTVNGGKARIAISGNDAARVFEVEEGAKLALINLTVDKGHVPEGAGGGVLNRGHLTVDGSTLSGNTASVSGGAIANSGSVTVKRSTLSGNTASVSGGALHNRGTLAVTGSTLAGNGAASGGGIEHAGGSAVLRNTIVADSASGGNCHAPTSPLTDGGYNLSTDTACGFSKDSSRLVAVADLGLDPALDDNGGPTQTHALLGDSPAVDRGRSFGATADQRGLPRPTDLGEFGNGGGDGSDIGAYEQVRCSGGVVNAAGTIIGNARSNTLEGSPGDDFIFGLGCDDTIRGRGGNDEVCSGKGNDRIEGGEGNDKLLGGEGKDRLRGDGGDDCLEGLLGDDKLNTKDGVPRNDRADGGPGQDVFTTDSKAEKARCLPPVR